MNKKNKNILFIVVVIVIISFIAPFNYIMDPLNCNSPQKVRSYFFDNNYNYDMTFLVLKLDKVNKYQSVIIGGSDVNSMMISSSPFYKRLTLTGSGLKQIYEALEAFIDLHPETKSVIINISYLQLLFSNYIDLPKYTGANLNVNEITKLYFSISTTKESILLFTDKIKLFFRETFVKSNNDNSNTINNQKEFCVYPYRKFTFERNYEKLQSKQKENFQYLEKMVNLLKSKNIKINFTISPANSMILANIYKDKYYRKIIEDFKHFLVSLDVNVYDMAYANKYTNSKITSADNYLYRDMMHPSILMGDKIFNIFFDPKNDKKDFYYILTKENINKVIEKENYYIEDYIKSNKKLIKFYDNTNLDTNYAYCRPILDILDR